MARRGAKILLAVVASSVLATTAHADVWKRASNRLTAALDRELQLTRTATELSQALGQLDRERASLEYTATVLDHASKEGMRKLSSYRRVRDDRERRARTRARTLYKLSRGGVARLALEDMDPEAEVDTSARITRGRTLRFLVEHDLRELAVHRRAEERASAELVDAARELQALSAVAMIESMQEHALVTAEQAVEPELRKALRQRRRLVDGVEDSALRANRQMLRLVKNNWRELRSLRGLDGAAVLIRPVPGRILGAFGSYEDPILRLPMVRNGVELAASRNAKVHAMADGRVVMVSRLPGFEDVVVVDHGGGQYTLTARLWDVRIEEGSEIEAGTVLGKVAPKPIDDGLGHTVYIELRHGEKPVDPTRYLRRASR